jgi:hypothetical protein
VVVCHRGYSEKFVEQLCYQNMTGQSHARKPASNDSLLFELVLVLALDWCLVVQNSPEASIQIGHFSLFILIVK